MLSTNYNAMCYVIYVQKCAYSSLLGVPRFPSYVSDLCSCVRVPFFKHLSENSK